VTRNLRVITRESNLVGQMRPSRDSPSCFTAGIGLNRDCDETAWAIPSGGGNRYLKSQGGGPFTLLRSHPPFAEMGRRNESAYPLSTIQMVIITAAINNPAPSHTISSLGAVGDLDLARATGGIFRLRIDFTCTPNIVKGRPCGAFPDRSDFARWRSRICSRCFVQC
jgi:hypothetical protein